MTSCPIRVLQPSDVDEVVALSLRAWAPVFESFERVLGAALFRGLYSDWRSYQAGAVRAACEDPAMNTWVCERNSTVAGFVSIRLNGETREGEIYMIAVDPPQQGAGLGSALTGFALEQMLLAGMLRASVGTGGDPGHAAARATYEKAGFIALPTVQYYKLLQEPDPDS